MLVHPSDMHFIWAQGNVLVVKSIGKEHNTYLKGHESRITTIALSNSGLILASGEQTISKTDLAALIVWRFEVSSVPCMLFRVKLHKHHV